MTTTRRIVAALVLAIFALVGTATVASAATPSKTITHTTWNAKHTVKTTDSVTTRATGTTHTVTVTAYAPKVKGKAQVKISQHRTSDSVSTNKKGVTTHKVTTKDIAYNVDGSVKSETETVEVL